MSEWVKCTDRMPAQNVWVLTYDVSGNQTVLRYTGDETQTVPEYVGRLVWTDCGCIDVSRDGITHWMPLPEPPK